MKGLATFGNDLYTGKRSIDFVGRLRLWLTGSLILLVVVLAGLAIRGLNLGIEFTGGSDFRVAGVTNTDGYADRAQQIITDAGGQPGANVTLVGGDSVRVQTQELGDQATRQVSAGLSEAFDVPATDVSASVIGPSWGESVSRQALQALVIFLVLVALMLALYFRTWKMSFAALIALAHDIVITVGIYSIVGFEVTPASMIGFLTILGYSLYDTVVVFDKVRENTTEALVTGRKTYSEAANLAVNQTLVRSINTSVVSLLPVTVILVVGFTIIGPGTLLDLALALFIGIAFGTASSIVIATPLLAWLREREPRMKELRRRVERRADRAQSRTVTALTPAFAGGGAAFSPRDAADPATRVFASAVRGAINIGGGAGAATPLNGDPGAPESPDGGSAATDVDGEYTATGRPIHPSMRRPPAQSTHGPGKQPKRAPRSKR